MGSSKKPRPARSAEELKSASVHVHYELEMLVRTATTLEPDPPGDKLDTTTRRAYVESFTVHTRSLVHFLWAEAPEEDDIVATDFVPGWHVDMPASVLGIRTPVAKLIAHLTYARPDPGGEKDWPCRDIARELVMCMFAFQREVKARNSGLLAPRWRTPENVSLHERGIPVRAPTSPALTPLIESLFFDSRGRGRGRRSDGDLVRWRL